VLNSLPSLARSFVVAVAIGDPGVCSVEGYAHGGDSDREGYRHGIRTSVRG
jgi:hypothetical protein